MADSTRSVAESEAAETDRGSVERDGKSAEAFRTISEVSDDLDVPQHVLRFWETKFPQVQPLKRGGGRRYYRPEDVKLLRRIRHWLYVEGYTIRGVQRLLKEGAGRQPAPPPVAKGDPNTPRPTQSGAARQADDPDPALSASGPGKLVLELQGILDELEDLRSELRSRLRR